MFTHEQIWDGLDRLASIKGYSASGLAKKAGLDSTAFNKSKRISPEGKPRWPSTESLAKVLAVTDMTMAEFTALVDSQAADNAASGLLSDQEIAARTAEILLETESVLFNARTPFTLKSGKASPVYIDGRRLISFVEHRDTLMNFGASMLRRNIGTEHIDIIAGGETAGIPYGALIADRLKKPMIYIRKKPKGYGRMAQIEGVMPEKSRVILVEDLQTDGGSKKTFIDAVRQAGGTVTDTFVLFHYGIFPASTANMKALGVTLHALATWHDVLAAAKKHRYFDPDTLRAVESFLNNPEGWTP